MRRMRATEARERDRQENVRYVRGYPEKESPSCEERMEDPSARQGEKDLPVRQESARCVRQENVRPARQESARYVRQENVRCVRRESVRCVRQRNVRFVRKQSARYRLL